MHRLTTNYAKNYCNRTFIVKVIVENVVTCFWGTRCRECVVSILWWPAYITGQTALQLTRQTTQAIWPCLGANWCWLGQAPWIPWLDQLSHQPTRHATGIIHLTGHFVLFFPSILRHFLFQYDVIFWCRLVLNAETKAHLQLYYWQWKTSGAFPVYYWNLLNPLLNAYIIDKQTYDRMTNIC